MEKKQNENEPPRGEPRGIPLAGEGSFFAASSPSQAAGYSRLQNKKRLKEIAKKYSLELVLLFGSRASGTDYKGSDFDIAYVSQKELNLEEESCLIIDLTPIFRSENIDLVNLKKSPPLLFYAIFQNCQILYEKESLLFPTWRAYAFKRYIESKPLYEEKYKKLEAKIASY